MRKHKIKVMAVVILLVCFGAFLSTSAYIFSKADYNADIYTESAEIESNLPKKDSHSNGATVVKDTDTDGEDGDDDAARIKIKLPIVMYHSTADKNLGIYNIKPKQFEEDLKYFITAGYNFITVKDLIDFKSGKALPVKPIMITIDDGCMNNYFYLFPLVKKYNVKCVMAVIGSKTDENYDKDGKLLHKRSHLTYEQIKEMHDSGLVEIQSHTYDMHNTGKGRQGMKPLKGESDEAYEKALGSDLRKLQERLREKTGIKCTAVAFPYGIYTERTIKTLGKLGYSAGFTCRESINELTPKSNLLKLKRINRASGKSADEFFKKYKI